MGFIFYFEIIGTIVFALQGSLVAIEKKLDILGIFILGVITSVGGGATRDVLLGNTPPAMFQNPAYCLIADLTVLVVVLSYRRLAPLLHASKYPMVAKGIHVLDAIGLGIFTVVGADIAIASGYGDNLFLCSFVGVITGVGGGLLRDILANRTPVILKRDIYAVASMIGAILYCVMVRYVSYTVAVFSVCLMILIIRMVAVYKYVHLPSLRSEEHTSELQSHFS